jgi:hypothetical protein
MSTGRASTRSKSGVLFYLSLMMTDFEFFRDVATANMEDSITGFLQKRLVEGQWFPDLSKRGLLRGSFDGRYRFGRYFGLGEHHTPLDIKTLLQHNDLELYDTANDPDELLNLAQDPELHGDLINAQNNKLNALILAEIGKDDGAEFPGPLSLYQL